MRCSICEGNVVNGRCAECGMLMPDERNRYHLNENMRDHKAHCETAKQREMHEKPGQQQTFSQKNGNRQQQGNQSRQNGHSVKQNYPSYSGDEKKKTNMNVKVVIGIVILLFVLSFVAGVIEEMQTDVGIDLDQWFEE